MTAVAMKNSFKALVHQSQFVQIIRSLKTDSGISSPTKGFMHKISKGVKTPLRYLSKVVKLLLTI